MGIGNVLAVLIKIKNRMDLRQLILPIIEVLIQVFMVNQVFLWENDLTALLAQYL